ncbi:MAG: substrate-binding domain-containing protein, partial [Arenicellales bacterium]
AGVAGFSSVGNALQKIADSGSTFTSRGDDSGTHKKELSLWQAAGIDVLEHDGAWYRETGSGMGATLNVAAGMDGYTMTDRSTWLKFSNKANLKLLVEGDPMLFNQYGVILVNPSLHSHIKATDGQLFIDWLISEPGQLEINQYRIEGRQAFFANAPIQ